MLHKKKTRTVDGIYIGVEGRPGRDFVCHASEEAIERLWHKS